MATTTKKKPSAAQLAARKLFAERAKAGTLGKVKRKAPVKRKANPVKAVTKKSRIETKVHRAKVSGAVISTLYIVETSKDGKRWAFVEAHYKRDTAERDAKYLSENYPSLYIRVNSHTVKNG